MAAICSVQLVAGYHYAKCYGARKSEINANTNIQNIEYILGLTGLWDS